MSHRRRIIIEARDADQMRYDTLGDWFIDDDGDVHIVVQQVDILPNCPGDILSPEMFLVALHELVEARLCLSRGITQEAVDEFDMAFQGDGEPGDDPKAPYRREHRFAMLVEMLMAHELGVAGYGKVE